MKTLKLSEETSNLLSYLLYREFHGLNDINSIYMEDVILKAVSELGLKDLETEIQNTLK